MISYYILLVFIKSLSSEFLYTYTLKKVKINTQYTKLDKNSQIVYYTIGNIETFNKIKSVFEKTFKSHNYFSGNEKIMIDIIKDESGFNFERKYPNNRFYLVKDSNDVIYKLSTKNFNYEKINKDICITNIYRISKVNFNVSSNIVYEILGKLFKPKKMIMLQNFCKNMLNPNNNKINVFYDSYPYYCYYWITGLLVALNPDAKVITFSNKIYNKPNDLTVITEKYIMESDEYISSVSNSKNLIYFIGDDSFYNVEAFDEYICENLNDICPKEKHRLIFHDKDLLFSNFLKWCCEGI